MKKMSIITHPYLRKAFEVMAFVMSVNSVEAAIKNPNHASPRNFTPAGKGETVKNPAHYATEGAGGRDGTGDPNVYTGLVLPTPSEKTGGKPKGFSR